MAQQARPNVSGQMELPCAQATAFSTVVSPSIDSRSSTPSSRSNTLGPLVGQSRRSDFKPYCRSRLPRSTATRALPCARCRRRRREDEEEEEQLEEIGRAHV